MTDRLSVRAREDRRSSCGVSSEFQGRPEEEEVVVEFPILHTFYMHIEHNRGSAHVMVVRCCVRGRGRALASGGCREVQRPLRCS